MLAALFFSSLLIFFSHHPWHLFLLFDNSPHCFCTSLLRYLVRYTDCCICFYLLWPGHCHFIACLPWAGGGRPSQPRGRPGWGPRGAWWPPGWSRRRRQAGRRVRSSAAHDPGTNSKHVAQKHEWPAPTKGRTTARQKPKDLDLDNRNPEAPDVSTQAFFAGGDACAGRRAVNPR